jgi:hypothetical protein
MSSLIRELADGSNELIHHDIEQRYVGVEIPAQQACSEDPSCPEYWGQFCPYRTGETSNACLNSQ